MRTLVDVEALQQSLAEHRRHAYEELPGGDLIAIEIDAAGWTFAEIVGATLLTALKAFSKHGSNESLAGINMPDTPPRVNVQISFAEMHTRGTEQLTEIYQTVFARLKFAREVAKQAEYILEKMHEIKGNSRTFNGVHLRIERDIFAPEHQIQVLEEYLEAMARDGFDASTLLYMASGIFENDDQPIQIEALKRVKPYCIQAVHHNTWRTTQSALKSLNPEQVALVDFMVLAESDRFLGDEGSSMSRFLMNYRHFRYLGHTHRFVKTVSHPPTFFTSLFFDDAFREMHRPHAHQFLSQK